MTKIKKIPRKITHLKKLIPLTPLKKPITNTLYFPDRPFDLPGQETPGRQAKQGLCPGSPGQHCGQDRGGGQNHPQKQTKNQEDPLADRIRRALAHVEPDTPPRPLHRRDCRIRLLHRCK